MNRFERAAYDTWKTASPPEDDLDKYEGLIDENGYIDYDGLSLLLAEVKRLRKAYETMGEALRENSKDYCEYCLRVYVDTSDEVLYRHREGRCIT
jgi:hypothetical protein